MLIASQQLKPALEAVLFMNHKPMSLARLQELVNPEIDLEEYRTAISDLQASFFSEDRGIELVEVANGYQLRTKMDYRDLIQKMFSIAPLKMSQAMLEVLAITAYNQPITKEKVEQIRGVDCSHLVRTLMDKKMIRMVGKSEDLGKPMLYGTTKEFLELFGLRDLSALPSLREIEEMLPANEVGSEVSEEELLAKEMEGIVDASKPVEFNDLELDAALEAQFSDEKAVPETEKQMQAAIVASNQASAESIYETQVSEPQQETQNLENSHSSAEIHVGEAQQSEAGSEDFGESLEAPRGHHIGSEGNA